MRTMLDAAHQREKSKMYASGPLTEEERQAAQEFFEANNRYVLDYEDLLIHSKILMDRIAVLVGKLLDDHSLSRKRFKGQRDWLMKKENIPYKRDEAYARFVRGKTTWFETMLATYRDFFIVHNETHPPFGTIHDPTGAPRPIATGPGGATAGFSPSDELMKLKEKYVVIIPELESHSASRELVGIFDSNSDKIDEVDLEVVDRVRIAVGAKLPDPNVVGKHIQEFVSFIRDHFLLFGKGNSFAPQG